MYHLRLVFLINFLFWWPVNWSELGVKISYYYCVTVNFFLCLLVFVLCIEELLCPVHKWKKVKSLSHVWLFATPWTVACTRILSPWDFLGKSTAVVCHYVQCISSVTQSCPTLCDPMNCSKPGLPVHHHLPEFTQTHGHRVRDAIQPSLPHHPLLLLPPIPPSIRVFYNESTLRMRWPKYWSFSFSIIPSKEIPGLISFRMDWLDLLAVPGTPKSLLQYYSSNTLILQHSAFFTVQLSHPYMTTGKNIALTRCTFVGKVMSLLFNILSRSVITFLPRSKCL